LNIVKRSHVVIWKWIQRYLPKRISSQSNKIDEFIVDETIIKVGSQLIWLRVAIEPKNGQILIQSLSQERNMFVAACFLSQALFKIVKSIQFLQMEALGSIAACYKFMKLNHPAHSPDEKRVIEMTILYVKDSTENFDGYFFLATTGKNSVIFHIKNWLALYVNMHNKRRC
jgi:putative transposase